MERKEKDLGEKINIPYNTGKTESHVSKFNQQSYGLSLCRKALETADKGTLKDRLLLLEAIFDTIPHPIYYKDKNGKYLGGNHYLTDELLGIPKDELQGKNIRDLQNYDLERYFDLITKTDKEVFESGKSISYYLKMKNIRGQYCNYLVNKAAFRNSEGLVEGLVAVLTDVTHQVNATAKAEEGERKLLGLLDVLQEVYFETSLEGVLTSINSSIEKISGYEVNEIIGKPLSQFYANYEDRAYYLEKLGQKGVIKNFEIKLKDKNGNFRRALINSKLVYDEKGNIEKIIGSLKDITDTYLYQQALRESEQKYRLLLENAGSQILFTDPAGKIILINEQAASVLGYKAEDLINKNIAFILEEKYASVLIKQINKVILTKKGGVEELFFDADGNHLWYLSNFQPVFDNQGNITGVVIISNDITDRKTVELEMAKLSQAVEQSTALIMITDPEGKIEYVNPRYKKVTGYSLNEIHGKAARILSGEGKSIEEYIRLKKDLEAGEVHEGQYANQKKDGREFWEKVIISPVFDSKGLLSHHIIVSEDITESRKAKEKERIIRENLIILNDTALNILKVSPDQNIYKLIGEQLKVLLPESIFSVSSFDQKTNSLKTEFLYSHQNIHQKFANFFQIGSTLLTQELPDELREKLYSGDMFSLSDGLYNLMMGKIPRFICTRIEKSFEIGEGYMRGITRDNLLYGAVSIIKLENKKIDNHLLNNFFTQASLGIERKKLENELVEARDSAEEMNRLKTVFLANMSHELRTPLNGILGFSEILTEQTEDPRQKEMLEVIHKSGLRLLDTLNTILDFSTIEAKNIVLTYSEENVVECVREVIKNHLEDAGKKSLSLIFKPAREEIKAYIVKEIVQKIIRNLLNNAIKFTSEGKIIVSLNDKKFHGRRHVKIEVKDNGIGINEHELKDIFREFRQGSEGFTRRYEGTGLGLTISKKFTDLLNGTIDVKSSPGKGSAFTLHIPLHDSPPY